MEKALGVEEVDTVGELFVDCDGVPVRRRVVDVPARVGIDVDGVEGASGAVGWRVDEVAR
ncbi:hypothetical protein [Streptomyces sp. NPDC015242]|uniref:hypothetical protein n=1 Tax=Streptomyces sp. NPDC015242 TaxID=3364951 RepID=UPI0036FA08F9